MWTAPQRSPVVRNPIKALSVSDGIGKVCTGYRAHLDDGPKIAPVPNYFGWPDVLPKCDFCDMNQGHVAASDTSSKRVAILANRRHDDRYRPEKGKNGARHRTKTVPGTESPPNKSPERKRRDSAKAD